MRNPKKYFANLEKAIKGFFIVKNKSAKLGIIIS